MAEKNLGDLRAKFKVDVDQMEKLVKGVKSIRTDFDALSKSLKNVNTQLSQTLKHLQGIKAAGGLPGGGGGSLTSYAVTPPLGDPKTSSVSTGNITQNQTYVAAGVPLIPKSGGGGGGAGGRAAQGMQYLAMTIDAMNQRMDNNYDRSLSVDKLGVYYQQQQGISQMQYVGMRQPMMGERLGYGGISTMLAMQAQTGLSAQGNAAGFAGMRALSGYSIGTDQLAQQAATLAGPAANNRLTMMLGTGMYGLGGQQRSMDKVMQQIVQRTGLTNEGRLAGARQAGSNTRAMLMASGVPEDMIDQILDYANANVQYQKKTGKTTMYDPSKKSDRQIMGIEKNFATQAEETARVKEGRDENYYRRQADNLAQFEKNTQAVTKALGQLEETLSGIIGANISSRGSILRKAGGAALIAGGALLAPTSMGASLGLSMLGATLMGDPPESGVKQGGGAKVPMGYSSPAKRVSLGELSNSTSFRTLNSTFKDRLLRMFADNPNVGLGVGTRSEADQRALFFSRYKKVTDGSAGDVEYNGEQYKHISGAPAAPPGRSMHEIGLAADLVGDLDWVQENAAKYGLKTFGKNLGEPWHIQPAELPDSRWEYEKQGSKWGQPAGTSKGSVKLDPSTGKPTGGYVVGDKYFAKYSPSGHGGAETFNQVSISDIVSGPGNFNFEKMDGAASSGVVSKAAYGESSSKSPQGAGTTPGGAMDPAEIAQLLSRRGFKGKDITNMLAISWRESRWRPGVLADDSDDLSYGLFQINMKDDKSVGLDPIKRRQQFGISKNEDLYDPKLNIKAARILFGGGNYSPWNKEGNPMAGTQEIMPKAQAITRQLGLDQGDPIVNEPTRGGTTVQVAGGTSVTIAPNIYVTSTGNNPSDARRMAEEIARLLDNDLKRELLRTT